MSLVRRYNGMPSAAELGKVSGVVLLSNPPPVAVSAALFGKICLVGECEDGPFNTPTDLRKATDQQTLFGLFGYRRGNLRYQDACAVRSGGSEPWNGNLWVHSSKLVFGGGLTICRVDTSIGQIAITPRAFVQGGKAPFNLSPGQTFIVNANTLGTITTTFAGTAASTTASAGTYTSFTGGEVLPLAFDGGSSVDLVFQAGDNTLAAIISRINTTFGAAVASNASGQLKLTSTCFGTGSHVTVGASAAATTLGLTAATTNGSGSAADLSQVSQNEFKAAVEAASALLAVSVAADGSARVASKLAGTGTIQVTGGTATAALGFAVGASPTTAALSAAVTLPAGARAWDGSAPASKVLCMQSVPLAKGFTGTTLVPVRPCLDDGTYAGASIAAITTLIDKFSDLEWSVSNPSALSAALTAQQLDSRYLDAIEATKGAAQDVTKKINGIVSARQSNVIRSAIKQNAIDASANGHYCRQSFISPPNGSTAQIILGATAPGVSLYRAEESAYCAGGISAFLQELIDGGYSDDGSLVRHFDVMLASRWGSLTPGYNPGQLPEAPSLRWDPTLFKGLEPAAAGWDINAYAAFKAAGVCAAEFDSDTGLTSEEGVTSVDPASDPDRTRIARRTLEGFIGDSLTGIGKFESKRQSTEERRNHTRAQIEGLLDTLVGDTVSRYGVSATNFAVGIVIWNVEAYEVGSDDVIAFNLTVGPDSAALQKAG